MLGSPVSPVATVVVPAWKAEQTIERCLDGLRKQDLGESFEVVVVASGDDSTVETVRRGFPEVRLLRCEGRLSPGAARNGGVRHADPRAEVVAFLAADCVPEPDWLRLRMEAHRRGHALVAGFVDVLEPVNVVGWGQYLTKFWTLLGPADRGLDGAGPLFHLSYRRGVLDGAGPFPDAVVGEDTMYNQALIERGERILYDPAIRARHICASSWAELRRTQVEKGMAAADPATARLRPALRRWTKAILVRSLGHTVRIVGLGIAFRPRATLRIVASAPFAFGAIYVRRRAIKDALRGRSHAPATPGGTLEVIRSR